MRWPLLAQGPGHQRQAGVAGHEPRHEHHRVEVADRPPARRTAGGRATRWPSRDQASRPASVTTLASRSTAARARARRTPPGGGSRRRVRAWPRASTVRRPATLLARVTHLDTVRGEFGAAALVLTGDVCAGRGSDAPRSPTSPCSAELFAPVSSGMELCYQTFGDPDDEPLLLVMGLATQMTFWDPEFCAMLARRGYYVIRFDNRDVGRSSRGTGPGDPRGCWCGRSPARRAQRAVLAARPGRRRLRPARPPRPRVGPPRRRVDGRDDRADDGDRAARRGCAR